ELRQSPAMDFFELKGVCDLNQELAKDVAAEYGTSVIANLDNILNDDSIDAVALMTPPWGRRALIEKIAARKKHIMTTKPFELDPAEGIEALRIAKDAGIVIYMNSPAPDVSEDMKQIEIWSKEFKLGSPVGARAEMWAKKKVRPGDSWYKDRKRCPVAPIFRIGIYLINKLVLLFGEAESVQVMHTILNPESPLPTTAQLSIRFNTGAICSVYVSFDVQDGMDHRNSFTINFERGTLYSNVGPMKPDMTRSGIHLELVTPSEKEGHSVTTIKSIYDIHSYPWESFFKAINGSHSPQDGYSDKIIAGLNIIEAMAKAEVSGKTEAVRQIVRK
ncbi:MAG: Gfo/Idh/MocA family oxidoreductase, partial [Fibrobacteres bacterium]|nr:Gfo/Idh/MocA family oxidoreductase [Fibrobacterota bacterium]